MGACFQAPHATPGQRQMETQFCVYGLFRSCHNIGNSVMPDMSFNSSLSSPLLALRCAEVLMWMGYLEPVTIPCENNKNNNNNKFRQWK